MTKFYRRWSAAAMPPLFLVRAAMPPAPAQAWPARPGAAAWPPHSGQTATGHKVLLPVEVPLDIGMLDVDDDRPPVRAGERIRRLQHLGDQPRHLLAAERAVDFDRGLAGQ